MKSYVVVVRDWDYTDIAGIFATLDGAMQMVNRIDARDRDIDVREFVVGDMTQSDKVVYCLHEEKVGL